MRIINRFGDNRDGGKFGKSSDSEVIHSINFENIRNLHRFSIVGIIVESCSLSLFVALQRNSPNFWNTFFNVACCIAACIIAAILSKILIKKYKKTSMISSLQSNGLVTFFYVLLSIWGTIVDVAHYRNGDQMLTFYIVQFCFLCFVVMRPKLGGVLIAMSFAFLFCCLYSVNGAAGIQPLNLLVFAIIAMIGNAIKYLNLHESEKNKNEILELNKALQLEATIDDLTKIKNRNAFLGNPLLYDDVGY